MEYVLLILSVLCIVGQFSLTKLYQKCIKQTIVTVMFFILLQNAVSLIIFLIYNGFKPLDFTWYSLVLAAASTVIMIVYNILSIKIMSLGNVSVYSLFMMLGGMLLPFIEGLFVYPETNKLTVCKGIGVVVLPLILCLQAFLQSRNDGRKNTKLFYALCVCVFFVNGLTSIMTSLQSNPVGGHAAMSANGFTIIKNLMLIVVSAATLAVSALSKNRGENISALKSAVKVKPTLYAAAMSVVMSIGAFLLLIANEKIPNVVQYPVVSGGTIVLSAVASAVFFKEKQSKADIFCFIFAALATVLFLF